MTMESESKTAAATPLLGEISCAVDMGLSPDLADRLIDELLRLDREMTSRDRRIKLLESEVRDLRQQMAVL